MKVTYLRRVPPQCPFLEKKKLIGKVFNLKVSLQKKVLQEEGNAVAGGGG